MSGKITDVSIRNWIKEGKPTAGKSDGEGLTFTMSAAQASEKAGTWVFRYRMGGRQRERTIGRYPDIGLKRARELATEFRAKVQQGVDVAREKQLSIRESIAAWTVRQLAADYEEKVLAGLATATIASRSQKIRDYVLPAIGHLPAKDVVGADVVHMLERVADRSPKLVKPVLSAARLVFAHGIAKKIVAADPSHGITVKAIAGDTGSGDAARIMLTDAELKTVLSALPRYGRINELVVRILLATAVRIQALTLAEWEHVDFNKREWTIPPGDGRKSRDNAPPFVVPITEEVAGYFAELQTLAGVSKFVLPIQKRMKGREGDAPMRQHTINAMLSRLCDGLGDRCRRFSPHDLRSTARSNFAKLGVSLIVAERCLNHTLGGLVATYDQHDYLDERRRALDLWSTRLAAIEAGASNVVSMAGRGAA